MRIAVIGGGVSGLVSAALLHERHDVTLFEADARIGGHVHTVPVPDEDGTVHHVDTGFIVYNERNYPLFTKLLRRLGVETQPSDMSFSVRCDRSGLEYNGTSYRSLFAQRRNLARPGFHRMLLDIVRFNRRAGRDARNGHGNRTLREYLGSGRYGSQLAEHYLVPMGSALWSTPPSLTLEMPLAFFVGFFENHGMLTIDDRPLWRVIRGGSTRYVEALVEPFRDHIRTSTPVRSVRRRGDHVLVDGERFDHVVLACHADDALSMLDDPSRTEREILGALPYQTNEIALHTDTSVLPTRPRAWGAWNYRIPREAEDVVRVTYDMNVLQTLPARRTFCVTLNGTEDLNPDSVLFRTRYRHPVYTLEGMRAQRRLDEVSGWNRTHYCGAYWGYGFHEDGVRSAVRAAQGLGVPF